MRRPHDLSPELIIDKQNIMNFSVVLWSPVIDGSVDLK